MVAIMLQPIPSFHAKFSEKSLFILFLKKNIVCKDYFIAHHDDKACLLPACKYHIILLGEFEELLHQLDKFCFTYQHVDCRYTLFKYRFSGKISAKSENMCDIVQRAMSLIKETEEWTKCRVLQKKVSREKSLNSIL